MTHAYMITPVFDVTQYVTSSSLAEIHKALLRIQLASASPAEVRPYLLPAIHDLNRREWSDQDKERIHTVQTGLHFVDKDPYVVLMIVPPGYWKQCVGSRRCSAAIDVPRKLSLMMSGYSKYPYSLSAIRAIADLRQKSKDLKPRPMSWMVTRYTAFTRPPAAGVGFTIDEQVVAGHTFSCWIPLDVKNPGRRVVIKHSTLWFEDDPRAGQNDG